eukprot:CAMPEP_0168377528 /NCGR_PEP_ID=MMETSP0228-20121227/10871_1 /TAXON_ID=133427 /ORGANISM="Protoceratium reticulatum, Strain CCCM 535 (=CCMP 1889)" /LENGTH=430 /DNA_ID=CAMNT_0008390525 /DNA_START=32 /DNA_END=1325 /DNA_ORIENTATION=+
MMPPPTAVVEGASAFSPTFSIRDVAKAEENWVTTTSIGREGHEKILRYDLRALIRYSGILTSLSKGTVFTMDNTAIWNVFIMILIAMLCCAISLGASWTDTYALAKIRTEALEATSGQLNQFVPFCLALYVSLILTRWWELRVKALGKVFDSFQNVTMLIATELPDKKWEDLRQAVAKFGFASIETMVQAARNTGDLDKLEEMQLLTAPEMNAVKNVGLWDGPNRDQNMMLWQRPMMLWAWIVRICVAALDKNKSPAPIATQVVKQCVSAREGMATMNMYMDSQLPFAYVHLITLLVNVQNIVVSAQAGVMFAKAWPDRDIFVMLQQVATVLVVCFIYQALLQITYMILDPFGDDVLDFPIKAYTSYVATVVEAMYEAQQACPVVAEDGSLKRPRLRRPRGQACAGGAPETEPVDAAAASAVEGVFLEHI